jgi:hypothetical protein
MSDLASSAVAQNHLESEREGVDFDNLLQLIDDLHDLQIETSQLESELQERTSQLLDMFTASFPPLNVIDIVSVAPDDLARWFQAGASE